VATLEGYNLVLYYYLCKSEIWSDKRSGLWLEWPYIDSTVSLFSILFISVPFYQWRPNVSVSDLDDSVGSCVVVAVHPPFLQQW
jgi:hypothetical protein